MITVSHGRNQSYTEMAQTSVSCTVSAGYLVRISGFSVRFYELEGVCREMCRAVLRDSEGCLGLHCRKTVIGDLDGRGVRESWVSADWRAAFDT